MGTAESTAEKRIVIRERSTDMPRMSKSKKLEWSFFLNDRFVLFVGTKKLVKRKEFEQFISEKLVI